MTLYAMNFTSSTETVRETSFRSLWQNMNLLAFVAEIVSIAGI